MKPTPKKCAAPGCEEPATQKVVKKDGTKELVCSKHIPVDVMYVDRL